MKKGLKTKRGLKSFEKKGKLKSCDICHQDFKELSSISYRTWDISRRYLGSKRPIIGAYKMSCCPKCFSDLIKEIDAAIKKVTKKHL